MIDDSKFSIGQRVRIGEEEDPASHVGKMAMIERLEASSSSAPTAVIKVDHTGELLTLPQHFLEPISVRPSSVLASDLFLPWDINES